jgi:hypothetical protein
VALTSGENRAIVQAAILLIIVALPDFEQLQAAHEGWHPRVRVDRGYRFDLEEGLDLAVL